MQPNAIFQTNYSIMSVKFSPFSPDIIAVAAADNFGIAGKGKSLIVQLGNPSKILFDLPEIDSVFDVSWSEADHHLMVAGGGNGEIKMWDVMKAQPIYQFKDSSIEVHSVEFSGKTPQLFIASFINGITKLYDVQQQKCVQAFQSHKGAAYQATWHPVNESIFATSGQDGAMRLWDLKAAGNKNMASVKAHQAEVLSIDFNKYQEQIATSSIDKTIKIWDLRNLKIPVNILVGHRLPVRKIKFSNFQAQILASASYDMSVNIWNTQETLSPLLHQHTSHTEFVVSVDFSIHNEKQIASGSWDGKVLVWQWDQPQPLVK